MDSLYLADDGYRLYYANVLLKNEERVHTPFRFYYYDGILRYYDGKTITKVRREGAFITSENHIVRMYQGKIKKKCKLKIETETVTVATTKNTARISKSNYQISGSSEITNVDLAQGIVTLPSTGVSSLILFRLKKNTLKRYIVKYIQQQPIKTGATRRVIYVDSDITWSDNGFFDIDIPAIVSAGYTHVILAFLIILPQDPMKVIAYDSAAIWLSKSQDEIKSLKAKYPSTKFMVSFGGATVDIGQLYTAFGDEPKALADQLAAFVNQGLFDGIDLDLEGYPPDSASLQQFTIDLSNAIRESLPKTLISHAPQAPYFGSAFNGLYHNIDKATTIDFYNIQYYNQGPNEYLTYETIFIDSGMNQPLTAITQINSGSGYEPIPLDKIVLGKPVRKDDANNGYIDPSVLWQYIDQYDSVIGGVMGWQYHAGDKSYYYFINPAA